MNLSERNVTHGHLLRWLLLTFLVVAFGAAKPAQAQVTASPVQLCGNYVQATFTNKTCKDTLVSLASYCITPQNVNSPSPIGQILFCYDQQTVKAGCCLTLWVSVPCSNQCPKFQADAATGPAIVSFSNPAPPGYQTLTFLAAPTPQCWCWW